MNREIKFRGKRIDNGEWVYGYYSFDSRPSGGHLITNDDECNGYGVCSFEVHPESVGQFIEQKDKHGNEIFHGDIISNCSKWHDGNTWVIENKFGCSLMRFVSGVAEPTNGFILSYDFNLEIYEIIGNIFDNPELPQ